MGIRSLRIDTTDSFSLAGTNVIPVLNNAPTLTGFNPSSGPAAALVTLDDLATYFGGGGGVTYPLLAGNGIAHGYSFTADPTAGLYYDNINGGVVMKGASGNGFAVTGDFLVGAQDEWAHLAIYPGSNTIQLGVFTSSPSHITIGGAGGTIGFFGVSPGAQPVVAGGATTDDVITALQGLGLFAGS